MMHRTFTVTQIGVIRTPFSEASGTPIQSALAECASGTVEVDPEYVEGLKDLDGFERVWLLYWFDRAREPRLRVTPFRDTAARGLFATRAPCRPNPIGMSPVRLVKIVGNRLEVEGVDVLDGTPLLDIKPYAPAFDVFVGSRSGWLGDSPVKRTRADGRFANEQTRGSA